MKKIKTCFIIFLGVFIGCTSEESNYLNKTNWSKNPTTNKYINLHKHLAYEEMRRTGIPASVKMAQAILESDRGKSELARTKNNHFGIKCRKKRCEGTYARYETVEQCWRDHSSLLRRSVRYKRLFRLMPKDYHGWAFGLQKCGYAQDKRYATKLIEVIEDNKLHLLDK